MQTEHSSHDGRLALSCSQLMSGGPDAGKSLGLKRCFMNSMSPFVPRKWRIFAHARWTFIPLSHAEAKEVLAKEHQASGKTLRPHG